MRVGTVPFLLVTAAVANSPHFRGANGIPDFDGFSNLNSDRGSEDDNQSQNETFIEELHVATSSPKPSKDRGSINAIRARQSTTTAVTTTTTSTRTTTGRANCTGTDFTSQCFGLNFNAAATTWQDCQAACCLSATCSIWQFSAPRNPNQCWMGVSSDCTGGDTWSYGGQKAASCTTHSDCASGLCVLGYCKVSTTRATTTTTTTTTGTSTSTHFMDAIQDHNWFSILCATTNHVICDDAVCEEHSNGVAACNCRKETTTASILPSENAGAPALTGSANYGLSMCFQMNTGKLYSAYSPSTILFGTMELARLELAKCPQNTVARTDYPMCWGAPCETNRTHPDRATCKCPVQTADSMPVLMDRFLVAPKRDCRVNLVPNTCDRLNEAGRGWMATVISAFAPQAYLNKIACNWDPETEPERLR